MEHGQSFKKKKTKLKLGLKGGVFKIKFREKCFNCGKISHRSMEYKHRKMNNKNHKANVVNDIIHDVSDINLFVMIFEVNLVGFNPKEW